MKPPRVLLVEDEPAIAELIAVNLRHHGLLAVMAEDGEAAQREIDAVLPDVILPVRVAEALRAGCWRR